MPKAWKEWEGRVVNKEFRLGEYLGGSESAGVFMTQYGPDALKAAVKLIPIGAWDQPTTEAELSVLQSARELSHPHLLRIFAAGRTTLDDSEIIFVVMEFAGEDLSQILPHRPLAAGEVREMLGPTLEALSYLHGKSFVHGHLKPSNLMAIGDQLKLSSDGISPSGAGRSAAQDRSDYAAPELAQGEISTASDVWSLGMLLVAALTQRLPNWDATRTEPILPANVPAPFDDIARRCLRRDPGARISVEQIAARLGLRVAVPAVPAIAKPELQRSPAPPRAAVGPQLAPPRPKTIPPPEGFPYQRRSNRGPYLAVAAVLVIVAILVFPRMFRSGQINSQLTRLQADSTAQHDEPSPAQSPSKIAQVSDQGTGSDVSTGTNLTPGEEPPRPSATKAQTPRRGLTAGDVAEQVVPDVPQSARDTIHGTVRVSVRLSVDTAGNVTEAELDRPGPSKYFARLALETAQQWKFDPPKMQGRNVLSDWLLQFQFTGQGTKVIPVQSDP